MISVLRWGRLGFINRFANVTTTLLAYFIISCVCSNAKATSNQSGVTFQASDYFSNPMLPETSDQKIVLIHIDQSPDMLERAYSTKVFDAANFDGAEGYFNAEKQYRYNHEKQFFEEDDSLNQGENDAWDGQFLNWLVMRKLDLLSLLLLGSDHQKNQGVIDLVTSPGMNSSIIQDPRSHLYSPIPSSTPINLKSGKLEYHNKIMRLRIKNVQNKKGLLDLIGPTIQFYFYSHRSVQIGSTYTDRFTIGDHQKLAPFLKAWKPTKQNKHGYHQAHLNALKEVLKKVKPLQKTPSSKKQQSLCQRYVHISMPHSAFGSLLLDEEILNDCQPNIAGKQSLRNFQWGPATLTQKTQNNTNNHSQYNYLEKHRLYKAIFNSLFFEEQSRSYQVTGADMSQFADGTAVLYQALSQYSLGAGNESINWVGDLRALLIDEQGRIRSDNGDKKLGSLKEDLLVTSCVDEANNLLRFRFAMQDLPELNCTQFNYPYLDKDVGYLWRASKQLDKLPEHNLSMQRFPFSRSEPKRYIRTHIDQHEYDFVDGRSYPLQAKVLGIRSENERRNFINYVRGEDQENKRSRKVRGESFLLGDTSQLSPVLVGKPAANYQALYGDDSYYAFLKQYHNRRSRVFMVSHDGMVHSFNAGWYDAAEKQIISSKQNFSKWELGQEIWAFIPYSVLPYLKEQSHELYGLSPEQHLKLFAQKPYIFDAKVFGVNAIKGQADRSFYDDTGKQLSRVTHPDGWGTLMVIGVGLGAVQSVDFNPSFLVFDITDAEQPPKFLASIKADNSGSAISLPSLMTKKDAAGDVQWLLALGSGASLDPQSTRNVDSKQSARVDLYNLKTLTRSSQTLKPKIIDLKDPNTSVAGITAVDWDLNGETDALYVNTARQKSEQNGVAQSRGSLHRISFNGLNSTSFSPKVEKVFTTDAPLLSRPQLSLDQADNRWLYLVTNHRARQNSRNSYENKIIGIKEPRDKEGNFLYESISGKSSVVSEASLLDVTEVRVNSSTGELTGSLVTQPKLSDSNVMTLEQRMLTYTEPQNYISGWLRRVDKGEIPHGENKLLGGILAQATFQPEYLNCQLSGNAFIYRLRFTTGTSWFERGSHQNLVKKSSVMLENTKGLPVASSTVSSILLHSEGETIRQIQSSSHGKTKTTLEENRHAPVSAEQSWREL